MRRHLSAFLFALAGLALFAPPPSRADDKDSDDSKPAVLIVSCPEDTELYIGGIKTQQTGKTREFDTPPLEAGKKYSYRVKAVWRENDREMTREIKAIMRAGETTRIDVNELKAPTPVPKLTPKREKKAEPKVKPEPENKAEPKKKPEPQKKPEPEKKTEPVKKPEPEKKTEPEKKPEFEKKPEPEKKPEKKPEPPKVREKKPEPGGAARSSPLDPAEVKVKPPAPKGSIALVLPETLYLRPGGRKLLPVKVVRTNLQGPVQVKVEGPPEGVVIKGATVAAEGERAYLEATASADAKEAETEVRVIGTGGEVRQDCTLRIKVGK